MGICADRVRHIDFRSAKFVFEMEIFGAWESPNQARPNKSNPCLILTQPVLHAFLKKNFFLSGNYIVTLFLPMITLFDRHRQWRKMMDRAMTFWMLIPLFFLHFVFRVRMRATGDLIRLDEPAIIIMKSVISVWWCLACHVGAQKFKTFANQQPSDAFGLVLLLAGAVGHESVRV